ncbi:MAG: sensor histidine kinase, partial [Halohasta sp.]
AVTDTRTTGRPAESATTEISDGIVGLRSRVGSLELASTDLDGMALDVSRSLMGAAPDEMAMKTEWALQSLAAEIDANHCLIYETDDDIETLELTHGWSADEISESEPHSAAFGIGTEEVPAEQFPGFETRLQQFEAACVDVTQFADSATAADAAESDSLVADAEVGTLLALPIVIEWQLSGVIVITVDSPQEWSESARQRLQAVGELVGHMERRRRQRQELERQNEQLEQFASVISHDLQNPLNVISGYLELAMETGDLDRLDPAIDAADRMEEMLEDLLTLAREGRAVGETEELELQPVVQEAWESVETYDASLELVGVDELDPVEADDSRLQEAFENLFKNAIVHAGEDVNMRVEADDGTVYVADDGPGIPEDKRDVVFEYGHTGGDGTGLGLAIVRSIIEGHGWEVSAAESEEGGARFDIDLGR